MFIFIGLINAPLLETRLTAEQALVTNITLKTDTQGSSFGEKDFIATVYPDGIMDEESFGKLKHLLGKLETFMQNTLNNIQDNEEEMEKVIDKMKEASQTSRFVFKVTEIFIKQESAKRHCEESRFISFEALDFLQLCKIMSFMTKTETLRELEGIFAPKVLAPN